MTREERAIFEANAREHARAAERQILERLQELATEYDNLRQNLRTEAERFQRLTREPRRDRSSRDAEEAGRAAVETARNALRDLPRAATLFLIQNPNVYQSIAQAGSVRLWAQGLSKDTKPLPRLLEMLDEALYRLQNPGTTE